MGLIRTFCMNVNNALAMEIIGPSKANALQSIPPREKFTEIGISLLVSYYLSDINHSLTR